MATVNQIKYRLEQAKKKLTRLNKVLVETKAYIEKMEGGKKKIRVVRSRATVVKTTPKYLQGYKKTAFNGIYIPNEYIKSVPPVPPGKLRAGFSKAKNEINGFVSEIMETMTTNYKISEIELSASFSADGKFLGFGVGGAATIKIKLTPEK